MSTKIKSSYLIGNKQFYKTVLRLSVPIMIQNGITNFVSLLDNIMIGQIGTEAMSGVSIVNQILNVFNLSIFGLVSGAGIFGAQFYGSGNEEGFQQTTRFKVISSIMSAAAILILFLVKGDFLISLFLHSDNQAQMDATMHSALQYLGIMMIQMIPYALIQAYSSSLRERGETVLPMLAGMAAVVVNMMLNYVLIFGKLGLPVLGVKGAAIATVTARFVELFVVVIWTHLNPKYHVFTKGLYTSFGIQKSLIVKIMISGFPLMLNEGLWAGGMAVMMGGYSIRGLDTVAAFNISSTLSNLFNILFIAFGNAIAIMIGQLLGAQKFEEAKKTAFQLIFFSTISCAAAGLIMMCFAPFFPLIYNTTDGVRHLATRFLIIASIFMPSYAFMNAAYFTIRSGGKTLVTFLFDSCFVWAVSIPLCFILTKMTALPITTIYFICQASEIIKCIIGYILVKKGIWINNLTQDK